MKYLFDIVVLIFRKGRSRALIGIFGNVGLYFNCNCSSHRQAYFARRLLVSKRLRNFALQ